MRSCPVSVTLIIDTPEPMFTSKYGNKLLLLLLLVLLLLLSTTFVAAAVFTLKLVCTKVLVSFSNVNASSLIVFNKKFAPLTAHAISSSFCNSIPNASRNVCWCLKDPPPVALISDLCSSPIPLQCNFFRSMKSRHSRKLDDGNRLKCKRPPNAFVVSFF